MISAKPATPSRTDRCALAAASDGANNRSYCRAANGSLGDARTSRFPGQLISPRYHRHRRPIDDNSAQFQTQFRPSCKLFRLLRLRQSIDHKQFFQRGLKAIPHVILVESMASIVRTEMRVPAGIVTYSVALTPGCSAALRSPAGNRLATLRSHRVGIEPARNNIA
jgi:hypothetical protein